MFGFILRTVALLCGNELCQSDKKTADSSAPFDMSLVNAADDSRTSQLAD